MKTQLTALLLLLNITPVYTCTTIIVGKEASSNGKIIIARTSDTIDARRAKNIEFYLDANHKQLYRGLPYWDLADDQANDMAQVVTNSFGLSVSATETIHSNSLVLTLDTPAAKDGIAEPNIPAIVMPTAKNAEDAVTILGHAIEKRGINAKSGFGVLIADQKEAWYLETLSGHQWVAVKIPDDVYFVAANGPGQIQAYLPSKYHYKLSSFNGLNPIQFAFSQGIQKLTPEGDLDFRATYGDVDKPTNPLVNYVRLAYLQHHFNPKTRKFDLPTINQGVFPTFLTPENKITVAEVQQLQASHYEDYPEFDPYLWSDKNEDARPFYYPIANLRTSNGHVSVVGSSPEAHYLLEQGDYSLNNLEYIALGMPTVSFYLPLYYGLGYKPAELTGAINNAQHSENNLFWQFRKLQSLVFLSDEAEGIAFDFTNRNYIVAQHYKTLADEIEADRLAMEKRYIASPDVTLINEFTQNTISKVSKVNKQLIEYFLDNLKIVERYRLFTEDELNQWYTKLVRKQDCDYRTDHCKDAKLVDGAENRLVDEPIL